MDKKGNYRKARKVIREFCRDVSVVVPLDRVILFGSFAKETATSESDIDLVFLSRRFAKMNDLERAVLIGKARKNYEFAMDHFGFTPEEFEKASPLTTLGEIKETGKTVFP